MMQCNTLSIAELYAAIDRFAMESPDTGHLTHFDYVLNAEPWDAGLVLIDLAARLVMIDSTYSFPRQNGVVRRHNIEPVEGGTVSFAIAQYEETLQRWYVQLNCACEKSTQYELSSDVETSVACFLDAVDELTTELERCVDEMFDNESLDDDSKAGFHHRRMQDFRRRKLLHNSQELRYLRRTFVNIQKAKSCGDWHADDLLF